MNTNEDEADHGPAAFESRLHELVDRHEITTLVHRLGAALDEGRFDELRAIFSSDATAVTGGGRAEGIDAVMAQASRNHPPDQRIQHVISDVLVDLDRDRGSVRANLHVTFADGDGLPEPRLTLGEIYRFDAARLPQGWRLTRVEATPVWKIGEISAPPR